MRGIQRSEAGDEIAFAEEHDAIGEVEGLVEIVGDEEDGFAEVGQESAEHVLHLGAGEGVECAEGLVHQQDGGLGGKGAGEADALALSAGELVGKTVGKMVGIEADGGEQFFGCGWRARAWGGLLLRGPGQCCARR